MTFRKLLPQRFEKLKRDHFYKAGKGINVEWGLYPAKDPS